MRARGYPLHYTTCARSIQRIPQHRASRSLIPLQALLTQLVAVPPEGLPLQLQLLIRRATSLWI